MKRDCDFSNCREHESHRTHKTYRTDRTYRTYGCDCVGGALRALSALPCVSVLGGLPNFSMLLPWLQAACAGQRYILNMLSSMRRWFPSAGGKCRSTTAVSSTSIRPYVTRLAYLIFLTWAKSRSSARRPNSGSTVC